MIFQLSIHTTPSYGYTFIDLTYQFLTVPLFTQVGSSVRKQLVTVVLGQEIIRSALGRMTPDATPSSIWLRSTTLDIDPAILTPCISLALFIQAMNNYAHSIQGYRKNFRALAWQTSIFDVFSQMKDSLFGFSSGNELYTSVTRTPKEFTDTLIEKAVPILQGTLGLATLTAIATLGLANPSLVPLLVPIARAILPDPSEYVKSYVDGFDNRDLHTRAFQPIQTFRQYICCLQDPVGYPIIPHMFYNANKDIDVRGRTFESIGSRTTIPHIIILEDVSGICSICSACVICKSCECGMLLCLKCSVFHKFRSCTYLHTVVPHKNFLTSKGVNFGPLDQVTVQFIENKAYSSVDPDWLLLGSGMVLLSEERPFYLGGKPSGLAIRLSNTVVSIFRVVLVYGFFTMHTGQPFSSCLNFPEDLSTNMERYSHHRCYTHTVACGLTISSAVGFNPYATDKCTTCALLAISPDVNVPSVNLHSKDINVSYGVLNVPFITRRDRRKHNLRGVNRVYTGRIYNKPIHQSVHIVTMKAFGLFVSGRELNVGDIVSPKEGLYLVVDGAVSIECVLRCGPGVAYGASCTCSAEDPCMFQSLYDDEIDQILPKFDGKPICTFITPVHLDRFCPMKNSYFCRDPWDYEDFCRVPYTLATFDSVKFELQESASYTRPLTETKEKDENGKPISPQPNINLYYTFDLRLTKLTEFTATIPTRFGVVSQQTNERRSVSKLPLKGKFFCTSQESFEKRICATLKIEPEDVGRVDQIIRSVKAGKLSEITGVEGFGYATMMSTSPFCSAPSDTIPFYGGKMMCAFVEAQVPLKNLEEAKVLQAHIDEMQTTILEKQQEIDNLSETATVLHFQVRKTDLEQQVSELEAMKEDQDRK